jgi:hypothetical protein
MLAKLKTFSLLGIEALPVELVQNVMQHAAIGCNKNGTYGSRTRMLRYQASEGRLACTCNAIIPSPAIFGSCSV